MKNFIAFMLALVLVVAAGTAFVTRGLSGGIRAPFLLEDAASLKRTRLELSGVAAEERRALGEFNRVELNGAGSVTIVLGAETSVAVAADRNVLPHVESVVRDGALILNVKPGVRFSGSPVSYAVTAKALSSVKTSGTGSILIEAPLEADTLDLRSEGSGDIRARRIAVKKLNVLIAGSGDVSLLGSAETLSLSILGSGDVEAPALSGRTAKANLAGSGSIELGAFEEIEANIAGSGDLSYDGNPRVSSRVLGSGKIRKR